MKITKYRHLQSGRVIPQYSKEVEMTIASMCPDKWLFVDLETGDIWHKSEDGSSLSWRSATKMEKAELRKLRC